MRHRDGEDAEDREQDLEEEGKAVAGRVAVVGGAAEAVDPSVPRGAEGVREARSRHHRHDAVASRSRQRELGHDREQHEADERRDGADLAEVVERLRPGVGEVWRARSRDHLASPGCATDVMSAVSTPGARPSANISATSGASSVSWPAWMSSTGDGYGFSAYIAPWNSRSM